MVYYCCCCYVSRYYYGIMIQGSPQDADPHFNPLQLLVFVQHIPRVFACVLPPGHIHPAITGSACRINESTCPQDLEPSHPLQIQAHSDPGSFSPSVPCCPKWDQPRSHTTLVPSRLTPSLPPCSALNRGGRGRGHVPWQAQLCTAFFVYFHLHDPVAVAPDSSVS